MTKLDNSEQWKLKGQCSICRRKYYCKRQCKANKETFTAESKKAVMDKLLKGVLDNE